MLHGYYWGLLKGISNTVLISGDTPTKLKARALTEVIIKYALAFKAIGAELAFIPLHLNEYLSPSSIKNFTGPLERSHFDIIR